MNLEVIKKLGGTTAVVWRTYEKPLWWATACDVNKAGVSNEPQYNESSIS